MPTYVYEVITDDDSQGEIFEVVQSMKDAPLDAHPETGEPVRRIIQPPMIGGTHSEASEKNKLSDNNLDRLGFTKYVKSDNGYDKVAGAGPDLTKIHKNL
ncbi:MAG: FmdB family transcriptional regulator [Planctomycetota bacterium]